jgi:RNA polymerase sigma factor (sigma-70 family)
MANPVGFLYRVAQSNARRYLRWERPVRFPPEDSGERMAPEPGLPAALAALREAHRVAVLLVHAHGWTYREVAAVLDVPESTVRNHVHRGMRKLRRSMGTHDEH